MDNDQTETTHARVIYEALKDGSGLLVLEPQPGLIVIRSVVDGIAHDAWFSPTDAAELALAILGADAAAAGRALALRQLLARAGSGEVADA